MKRPLLNKVPLSQTMLGGGKPTVNITMSVGQWDTFLQSAYDAGYYLIELDEHETPVAAYCKCSDGKAA
jgi:hypothetical protein